MGYKGISFCSYQEFVCIAFGPFILDFDTIQLVEKPIYLLKMGFGAQPQAG